MWRSIFDSVRRAIGWIGVAMNLIGAVLFVVPLALPADYIAAGAVLLGTSALGLALRDGSKERDELQARLDDRARIATALEEFQLRLSEGTDVERLLKRWKPPLNVSTAERNAWAAERIEEYAKAVGVWNEACSETVNLHLPHRRWVMRRSTAYGTTTSTAVPTRVLRLREEVADKMGRMDGLQRELQDQSGRSTL